MGRRIIIYPQGLAGELRDHCDILAHHCGGDLSRVLEREGGSLSAFLDYAVRLRVMRDRREDALVILTRTNPLTLLLPARRALEQSLPTLVGAVWAIYWDPARDPDLLERTRENGSLDDPTAEAPIWTAPNNMSFLVLSSRVHDPTGLPKRVTSVLEKPQRHSGVQRVDSESSGTDVAAG